MAGADAAAASFPAATKETSAAEARLGYMYHIAAKATDAMATLSVGIALQAPIIFDLTWFSMAGMVRCLLFSWQ